MTAQPKRALQLLLLSNPLKGDDQEIGPISPGAEYSSSWRITSSRWCSTIRVVQVRSVLPIHWEEQTKPQGVELLDGVDFTVLLNRSPKKWKGRLEGTLPVWQLTCYLLPNPRPSWPRISPDGNSVVCTLT